jgi:hypothetical protein
MDIKEIKNRLWEIIITEGIEVTNQNIDWLLSRVFKESKHER